MRHARYGDVPVRVRRCLERPVEDHDAGFQLLRLVRPVPALVMKTMLVTDTVDTPPRDEALRDLGIRAKPVSRCIRDVVAGVPTLSQPTR